MSYTPLKKEIVFSDEVKRDPNYSSVMEVIKSLGDPLFKQWLIECIYSTIELPQNSANLDNDTLTAYADLKAIGVILEGLVSREVVVDEYVVESCKQAFSPVPNPPVIKLLKNLMGFLLNMQKFERMIIKIDRDIDSGNVPQASKHLTRDGNAPVHLPRSRQTVNKYGKQKR